MKLSPGQVYEYETRKHEPDSRVVICKIEHDAQLGEIAHIAVENVHIKNPAAPDGVSTVVSHLPFDAASLSECLLARVDQRKALPDFEEGYGLWRKAFDAGEAGVFTISVAEALDAVSGG